MLKIGLVGCTGKLGRDIISYLLKDQRVYIGEAIARPGNRFVGVDVALLVNENEIGVKIINKITEVHNCDVLVDCTNREAFMNDNLPQYKQVKKPLLIATTGFSEDNWQEIKDLAKEIPILFSPNYSFALYHFIETVKFMARKIDQKTDVQILEYHHNEKRDSPSGTAIRILEAILDANPKLEGKQIKINSIRGGNIVGEHRVLFANYNNEQVELIHKVTSREAFASGIVQAAKWLSRMPSGYYVMEDVLKQANEGRNS